MPELHSLNFSLLKPVGEISEKKAKYVTQKGYNVQEFIPGQMLQLFDKVTENILIVGQHQITFVPNPQLMERSLKDPSIATDAFRNILDILLLDGESRIQLIFERSYESHTNTFEKSLKMFHESEMIMRIGANAVGFRIPFKRDQYHGELKVEPFFKNPKFYFIGCSVQSIETIELEQVTDGYADMLRMIVEEFEPLAQSIFNQE